jgi:hypothetical protein
MRNPTCLAGLVAAALLFAVASSAKAESPLPIYPATAKPTPGALAEFLSGGVVLDREGTYITFSADRSADYTEPDWVNLGSPPVCACEKAKFGVNPDNGTVEISACTLRCKEAEPVAKKFKFKLLMASKDFWVYRDEGGLRVAVDHCERLGNPGVARRCVARVMTAAKGNFIVEVIPGAAERAFFDKARERLSGAASEYKELRQGAVLVEGPPAKTPRTVSEIFYANDQAASAALVARALEVVLGPIDVRPWPGKSDFDVIVVVGDQRAPAPNP